MGLKRLQRDWDKLGRKDPLWAICSDPTTRGNRWDEAGFFAYGRAEIDTVMSEVDVLRADLTKRRGLDFGCGVGRITLALATHFDEVTGVDIAPSMIERAESYAARSGIDNCRFVVNDRDNLADFDDGSFDFVYSRIALQHIPPPFAERYIGELVRVLDVGGLALLQVPSRAPHRAALFSARQRLRAMVRLESKSQLYPVAVGCVHEVVREAGGAVVEQRPDDSVLGWESFRYAVVRRPAN